MRHVPARRFVGWLGVLVAATVLTTACTILTPASGGDATPASGGDTPTLAGPATPTYSGARGPHGLVTIDYTMTDTTYGYSITVKQATTVLVPAIDPVSGALTPGEGRMFGVEVSVDTSRWKSALRPASGFVGPGFHVITDKSASPDNLGKGATCGPSWFPGITQETAAPALAAVGGDTLFLMTDPIGVTAGWVLCYTAGTDKAFDTPGYTIWWAGVMLVDARSNITFSDKGFRLIVAP